MRTKVMYLLLLFLGALQVSFAQEKTVSGVVKDENLEPMLGASVIVKGTTKGVSTDENGTYSLKVKDGDVLEFTAVGYKTQDHKVTGKTRKIDVALLLDVEEIDEFVFVGFGQKQAVKEATGSIGKVDNISNSAAGSVDKALSGKIAGVQGGVTTGQPGGAANVRIRGLASINGRTNPIYIIDGVRVSQGQLSSAATSSNILANLNDEDIESVTVLKDAVSTAAYGADAGAGVIIITTKSGKKGEAKYSFNSEVGMVSRALTGEKNLTTAEWLNMIYDAYLNSEEGTALFPNNNKEALLAKLAAGQLATAKLGKTVQGLYNKRDISTDWRKETENSFALLQKVNGTVSGGNDRFDYYSSLGYYKQDGIVKQTGFQRVTNSNKITYRANDRLTLATDLQLSYGQTLSQPDGGKFGNSILGQYLLQPTDRAYNPDGTLYLGGSNRKMSNGLQNSVANQQMNYIETQTARAFGNFQADYKILKNLTYKFVFAPEFINIMEDKYYNPLHGDGYSNGGISEWYATRYFNFNVQNILSYDFKYKEKNNFYVNLIQEAYKSDYRRVAAEAHNVGPSGLTTLSNFIKPVSTSGSRSVSSRGGYAVTAHYDYDKFFLFDISGRQDRISNFWDDNKTGYFGSVGVGLDFARLEAVKKWKKVSQLKLSTSYGSVGNMVDVSPYAVHAYLSNYNDQVGGYISGVDNKDLRWETLSPFNLGLDMGFLKDRITFSVAYFHKKTSDMIFAVPLSRAQGNTSVYKNIGEMVNKGVELTFNTKIVDNEGDGFKWNLGANFTSLKNEVTKLYGGKDVISGSRIMREGEAARTFYMKKWAGVDPQNGDPLWYVNGEGGETTNDYNKAGYGLQGSAMPTYYGGVDTKLSYKNFTLSADLTYSGGNKIVDTFASYVNSDGGLLSSYPGNGSQVGNYWTPENKNARDPKPILGKGNRNATSFSTRYQYKGDFVRLQTVRFSYRVKPEFLDGTYLKGLEFYVLGNNVWTHNFDKNYKGDPDLNIGGETSFTLPTLRTYSFGVNVNL